MRFVCPATRRHIATMLVVLGGLVSLAAPVSAQGFGVGGRIAWVTSDDGVDIDAVRMFGGQLRLLSQRFGVEVSFDRESESFESLNQKVTSTPIQASLIMKTGGRVSPFLLVGPGWYRRSVEAIDGPDLKVTTTEFGWHGGIGLEVLAGKHFGIHGDYRYTFLDFNDDDDDEDDDEGFIGGLLPGHRGSMWTIGATVYF